MGLSNEERLAKFSWAGLWWRRALVDLHKATPKLKQRIVRQWIVKLDEIVGLVIRQSNTNTAFWLMGSNDTAFQHAIAPDYGLDRLASEEPDPLDVKQFHHESARAWQDRFDLPFFVGRLNESVFGYTRQDGLRTLAAFWHQWRYVDALLYPVYRYRDGFFPREARRLLTRLIGEMASRRLEICYDYDDPIDKQDLARHEHAMLAKFRYAQVLLNEAATAEWKDDNGDRRRETGFSIYPLCDKVAKMPLAVMAEDIEAREEKKRQVQAEFRATEEKNRKPTFDAFLGPPGRGR